METRLSLSQLPRAGDIRAPLNTSASLVGHHPNSPISPEEKPPVEHLASCCPQEWACVSPSGRHLCLQEMTGWGCREGQTDGRVHSDISGQLPGRSWLPFLFSCLFQPLFCVLFAFSSLFSWFVEFLCFLICLKAEVYKNTKGLLCLKYRCSFTPVGLHPDKPIVS